MRAAGDNVAIYANTSSRWQITAQACFANSFPVVTVYATLGEEAVAHALNLAEAKFVITEVRFLNFVIFFCCCCSWFRAGLRPLSSCDIYYISVVYLKDPLSPTYLTRRT